MLVDPETHGVVFVNRAAKELEIKSEGVTNFSWGDHCKQRNSFPLTREAFAYLDKRVLMQNLTDMESTIEELEDLSDYKSL